MEILSFTACLDVFTVTLTVVKKNIPFYLSALIFRLVLNFPSVTIAEHSSPYLQRSGTQQRGEYTVICNLLATTAAARSLSIAKFKLFRLLIVVVLLLLLVGVANFHRFCSTRIARRGTLPFAVATTVFPLRFPTVIPWGTHVFVATAATSATASVTATAIAIASSPSVAIVRAVVVVAAIAADRVVLLGFCIESQA